MTLQLTPADFEEARRTIAGLVHHTPLLSSRALSTRRLAHLSRAAHSIKCAIFPKPTGSEALSPLRQGITGKQWLMLGHTKAYQQ
jgi:hypothetical protein